MFEPRYALAKLSPYKVTKARMRIKNIANLKWRLVADAMLKGKIAAIFARVFLSLRREESVIWEEEYRTAFIQCIFCA